MKRVVRRVRVTHLDNRSINIPIIRTSLQVLLGDPDTLLLLLSEEKRSFRNRNINILKLFLKVQIILLKSSHLVERAPNQAKTECWASRSITSSSGGREKEEREEENKKR